MRTIHWGIAVDSEIPITGVTDINAPEWLHEDIDYGIYLDYEEHVRECGKEFHDDCYDPDGGTTYLIGYKKDVKGDYVPDPNAEYSAIVNGGMNTVQVTRSKWVSRAALCSPCYPGQGDLNNSGEYLTYALPPDVWGSHDHLQIFRLDETLEAIRSLYTALYNIDHPPEDFAVEFFYMVGELLDGKKLSELNPQGPAAETLKELLGAEIR